jgi:5-methylcytosine-specific restriction endonuclease McrA
MIPVQQQPEPEDFSERVRRPGKAFLRRVPHPTNKQWRGREYWRRALPDMRIAYKCVCAYCAHWISSATEGHTIDHFVPKAGHPGLAYEWSNFRYVALKFNARKGTRSILDPFRLEPNWFILDFDSFLVKPNPDLRSDQRTAVQRTIDILKLNDDEDCVELRQYCVEWLLNGEISFAHLQRTAPFIAYELERQGLVNQDVQE